VKGGEGLGNGRGKGKGRGGKEKEGKERRGCRRELRGAYRNEGP